MAITCCRCIVRRPYTAACLISSANKINPNALMCFFSFFFSFKFIALICLLLPLTVLPHPTDVHLPNVEHHRYITNEVLLRPKRAGSFDFVGAIKNVSDDWQWNGIGQLIFSISQTITGHIGKASASLAAGASSSSSSKAVVIEKPLVLVSCIIVILLMKWINKIIFFLSGKRCFFRRVGIEEIDFEHDFPSGESDYRRYYSN